MTRIAAPSTPATTPTPTAPVIAPKTIKEAETLLKRAGFSPGGIDGKMTPALQQALREFQGSWKLPATGTIDAKTMKYLRHVGQRIKSHKKSEQFISVGQKASNIKTIEARLKKLGYDVGKVDGIYSRETAAAVKAFKHDQGDIKSESGALAKKSRSILYNEVKALNHAPQRGRVKPSKAQTTLDTNTAKAAARQHADGTTGFGVGATGKAVINVQKHLRAAGFDPQRVSGKFDERTGAALKAFQQKSGLPATGQVDAKTWAKLKKSFILTKTAASPAQSLNERSGAVKATEKLLKKVGYNPGKLDGLFTKNTEKAVRAFEKKYKLKRDGKLDARELKKLKSVAKNSGYGPHGKMKALAKNARAVAMSMGGFSSQGLCATGVSRAIQRTYGIKVWGNGNQIDNNLPRSKFKQVHIPLSKALKIPGLILTWERTSSTLGRKFGHTAITLGDGHSSASDFIERNTAAGNRSRSGLKIFMPIK